MANKEITPEELASKRPPTVNESGHRLWLYPERRGGTVAKTRFRTALVLIAFYLIVPWIEIAGRPLIRIDVLNNVTYFMGLVLRMTEASYLFFIVATLALILFLATTLKGRMWCGYACPQTVFVDWLIRPIEELIEGKATKRRVEDAKPMNLKKALRKTAKHLVYFLIAGAVANAFLGFFVDPRVLISWILSPPSQHPFAFGFVMFITVLLYFDLGWFREQFCSFICPYARFQAALLDQGSPGFYYQSERGEPRGRGKQKGDCIDCGLCVRVCPTGIDIRNGLQLECIQCGRCADACDSVMTNIKRDIGLIKFTSEWNMMGKIVPIWKRVRILFYLAAIAAVLSLGAYRLSQREDVTLTFLRQKGAAFSRMPDGRIGNIFEMRAVNNIGLSRELNIKIIEPSDAEILCPRCTGGVQGYEEKVSPFIIILPKGSKDKVAKVQLTGSEKVVELPLLLPGKL